MSVRPKEIYLGDGLYGRRDDYGVWLLANSHTDPTDRVYLEWEVLKSFLRWTEETPALPAQTCHSCDTPSSSSAMRHLCDACYSKGFAAGGAS
jgi:hypothetical protein